MDHCLSKGATPPARSARVTPPSPVRHRIAGEERAHLVVRQRDVGADPRRAALPASEPRAGDMVLVAATDGGQLFRTATTAATHSIARISIDIQTV